MRWLRRRTVKSDLLLPPNQWALMCELIRECYPKGKAISQ